MIEAYFDGCCEPVNPGGYAAYGATVILDGKTVFSGGEFVGNGPGITNNVAEYRGAIRVLEEIAKLPGHVAIIRGDSKLVIKQLQGKWKCNGGSYVPYYYAALRLAKELRERIAFEWIPREKNRLCDALSKDVLRGMNVEFRIQPEEPEVKELKAEQKSHDAELQRICFALFDEYQPAITIEEIVKQVKALRDALTRYGHHLLRDGAHHCAYFDNQQCNCGFEAALKVAKEHTHGG